MSPAASRSTSGGDLDVAVGAREAGDLTRALERGDDRSLREAHREELVAPAAACDATCQRQPDLLRNPHRQPGKRPEQRHEQDVGVGQARGRVARQPEEQGGREPSFEAREQRRLARLHRHAVEDNLAALADRVHQQVALADGASACEDDEVRTRRRLQGGTDGIDLVGNRWQLADLAPMRANHGRQREPVDVVDAAGAQALTRHHDLVARRGDSHQRLGEYLDLGHSHRRERADARRAQPLSAPHHDLAGRQVVGAAPDVLPGLDGATCLDDAALARRVLDHHDGVGAGRHRRPGGDLDALAWTDATCGPVAGVAHRHPPKAHGRRGCRRNRVRRHDGVPVHRRAVEGRDVHAGNHVGCRDATRGIAQRQALPPIDRTRVRQKPVPGFRHGDGRRERAHGRVCRPGGAPRLSGGPRGPCVPTRGPRACSSPAAPRAPSRAAR